jgi:hypothetical protein
MVNILLADGVLTTQVDPDIAKAFGSRSLYNRTGYVCFWENKKHRLLHRFIMQTPTGMVVDHIDGDTYNNQRSNLRNCTVRENSRNRVKLPKQNQTGHLGVSFYQTQKFDGFRVYITVNGTTIFLGYFVDINDAIAARKAAAALHFGIYASRI